MLGKINVTKEQLVIDEVISIEVDGVDNIIPIQFTRQGIINFAKHCSSYGHKAIDIMDSNSTISIDTLDQELVDNISDALDISCLKDKSVSIKADVILKIRDALENVTPR